MKNFFKKLAFVLALAMVVTAIAPAAKANAAKAPVLNATSKKIYIGGDYTGKYSDTFTLKVWNKGDYRVTFASSDTKIATVTKWYGVVTAKAVGTATITATVSNKTTGKLVKKLSAKVYVKKNADSVAFGSLAKFDQPLTIGDKVKINVARKAGTVSAWKQADKTQITDYVVWSSSNKDVATVDKWGTVKAVGAGETTISAVATQIEGKVATTTPATVKVTVNAKGIVDVTQLTETKIKVTFGADQVAEKLNKDTLLVTPADASVVNPSVKEVKISDDNKKVATVELYLPLSDKTVYTVSVKDTDSKKDFSASVGDPASITVTKPGTAVVGEETKIEYVVKDANGVELSVNKDNVEATIIENTDNGYISTNSDGVPTINMYEKGKTVTIQLTYHTYNYDNDGNETVFKSSAFLVTGIDKTDVGLNTAVGTVVNGDYSKADFDKVKSQLPLDADSYYIQVKVKDAAGVEYTTKEDVYDNFTFESLNKAKLEVDENGRLYPLGVGTAMVKVTVKAIEKSFLVEVSVVAESKVTKLVVSDPAITLSNGEFVDDSKTVKVTVEDQYGNSLSVEKAELTFTADAALNVTQNGKEITINAINTEKGDYKIKVAAGNLSRDIRVKIQEPEVLSTYKKFEYVAATKVDLARNNDNAGVTSVSINYYGLDSKGVRAYKFVEGVDYELVITDKNSKPVNAVTNGAFEVVSASGSSLIKNVDAGVYNVALKSLNKEAGLGDVGTTFKRTSISVVDSQVKPVLKLDKTEINSNELDKVYSVSTKNKSSKVAIDSIEGYKRGDSTKLVVLSSIESDSTYVIKKVNVKETFSNGNYFIHTIDVSQSIKVK
ncbi:Ig-like domain-containing protein [Clostridium sp. Marseille-P299]|uniref:Ig-like domain-containing protein n=1 Tax=Clostridium sp. Marseille-P299 TaxID=1805477 RepID=UPI0008325964|nr:Ig-like domain-containing protein [Clostridium sp. Marseille-P299]